MTELPVITGVAAAVLARQRAVLAGLVAVGLVPRVARLEPLVRLLRVVGLVVLRQRHPVKPGLTVVLAL